MANTIPKKLTDKQLQVAITKSMGIVANIISYCKKTYGIEVTRQAIHYRLKKSPKLKLMFDDARENVVDLCESVVMKAIAEGDSKLAFNVLCKLGKQRGYTDEIISNGGEDKVQIIFDVPNIEIPSKADTERGDIECN